MDNKPHWFELFNEGESPGKASFVPTPKMSPLSQSRNVQHTPQDGRERSPGRPGRPGHNHFNDQHKQHVSLSNAISWQYARFFF